MPKEPEPFAAKTQPPTLQPGVIPIFTSAVTSTIITTIATTMSTTITAAAVTAAATFATHATTAATTTTSPAPTVAITTFATILTTTTATPQLPTHARFPVTTTPLTTTKYLLPHLTLYSPPYCCLWIKHPCSPHVPLHACGLTWQTWFPTLAWSLAGSRHWPWRGGRGFGGCGVQMLGGGGAWWEIQTPLGKG